MPQWRLGYSQMGLPMPNEYIKRKGQDSNLRGTMARLRFQRSSSTYRTPSKRLTKLSKSLW